MCRLGRRQWLSIEDRHSGCRCLPQSQIEYLRRIKNVRNIKADLSMQRIKLTWEIPV